MINSKAWNWEILDKENENFWKTPSRESYYLLSRWTAKNKLNMLDLGCGIGRHSMFFASNGFNVSAFDLSKEGVFETEKWAEKLKLKIDTQVGDMLNLPYEDESFDCIMCYNVISHSDTLGVKKVIKEIRRVLKEDGECYLTLCSKETWGFKQGWPLVDENTNIKMQDGPENGVPHFYADYDLIKKLFKEFKIEYIIHVQDFYENQGKTYDSHHYHILVKK